MIEWLNRADRYLLYAIHQTFSCKALDFWMPKITAFGNGGAVWLAAAAAMTLSKKYRPYGIAAFAAMGGGLIVGNWFLKNWVARPRPCWEEPVLLLIANPKDYSFPSGHTLSSVIAAYILTAANRKFGCIAIPLAASIGFSRLYLLVHYPSDVLASTVLGCAIGFATVRLTRKFTTSSDLRSNGRSLPKEPKKP